MGWNTVGQLQETLLHSCFACPYVSIATYDSAPQITAQIAIVIRSISIDQVIQSAQLAGSNDFIQQLPLSDETQIGEGGGLLSGGQRQRLAIARALLGNPRLLLFDEATSHLDTESERIIQNNLKTILQGRTSVIIAHRLSTVRNADLILVMDKGVLIESGNQKRHLENN